MKCEASEELTTSTLWMPDWYSWLMRWKTRSEPERSTSISMLGYSARNALATASATLTSTDVYQETFPSFAAAATMAGVVSCPWAMPAIANRTARSCEATMPKRDTMFLLWVSLARRKRADLDQTIQRDS